MIVALAAMRGAVARTIAPFGSASSGPAFVGLFQLGVLRVAQCTRIGFTLTPSGVKVPWWKDNDAAAPTGENRDCVMARWQKEHGRPAASYEPLEAKCRAAGGKL